MTKLESHLRSSTIRFITVVKFVLGATNMDTQAVSMRGHCISFQTGKPVVAAVCEALPMLSCDQLFKVVVIGPKSIWLALTKRGNARGCFLDLFTDLVVRPSVMAVYQDQRSAQPSFSCRIDEAKCFAPTMDTISDWLLDHAMIDETTRSSNREKITTSNVARTADTDKFHRGPPAQTASSSPGAPMETEHHMTDVAPMDAQPSLDADTTDVLSSAGSTRSMQIASAGFHAFHTSTVEILCVDGFNTGIDRRPDRGCND